MTLTSWPRQRVLSPAALRMAIHGWQRAEAEGWLIEEWCADVAAMFGVKRDAVRREICNSRKDDE